jgi:FtsP/CotA-like multicopper oxidase with cupredoxin domain
MNRREFLTLGAAAAGLLMAPQVLLAEATMKANRVRFPKPMEPDIKGGVKEYRLWVDIFHQEVVPKFTFHTLAFNDQVPGPEIRVREGEKVRVFFKNRTELNHTIHWHGLYVPWRMDGVPYVTQMPVMPNQEFVYEFEARPAGTHFYHCHWGTMLHLQAGMYGPITIEPERDTVRERFPYDREYTLIYSSHDVNFIRNELNIMLTRMKERRYLMMNGRFDKERFNLFDTLEEFHEAVKRGYMPPYATNMRAPSELPEPNWFTVNGKSYPETPKLYIRSGENIRVRLINAGQTSHSLHLHGHDFWMVSDDGLPVAQPWQMNTLHLAPGKTHDIIIEGSNRGIWTFHDHDTRKVANNGLYPGGTLVVLVYEDLPMEERAVGEMEGMKMEGMKMDMLPKVSLDQ